MGRRGEGARGGNAVKQLAGLLVAILLSLCASAQASTLTRDEIQKYFPPPLVVGQEDDKLPIWPVLKQEAGSYDTIAYVFQSNDFAPIPGFGGSPPNLLIAMAPDGTFIDVKVLAQHEPVFVDGLGPGPLNDFVQQYVGMSARHTIAVGRPNARQHGASPTTTVDGVAMATASTRIINQELLSSALGVARKKLGFGGADTFGLTAVAKQTPVTPMTWPQLIAKGYVKNLHLTNAAVDSAFAGTAVADQSDGKADATFGDTYVAELDVPEIGRNVLGDKLYTYLMGGLAPGDHAVMVLAAGPWSPMGDDFVYGAIPTNISIVQSKFPVTARDFAIERGANGMAGMPAGDWTILKINQDAGFDPTRLWSMTLRFTREHGQIYPVKVTREFSIDYALLANLFTLTKATLAPAWTDSWIARKWELAIIVAMLAVLVPVLVRQRGLVAASRRFEAFRLAYLALTLGFIGWYAQAQLSIVTLVGLVRTTQGGDLSFLLYDPPSLLLWGFALVTLVDLGPRHVLRLALPVRRAAGAGRMAGAEAEAPPGRRAAAPRPSAAQREICRARRYPRCGCRVDADCRQACRGRAVQDLDHLVFRALLAVRRLCDRIVGPQSFHLQGLLPLSLPAWGQPGTRRAPTRAELDSPPRRMRQPVPALQGQVPLRGDRADRQDRLSRVLPVHGLRDDYPRSQAMRAADPRHQEAQGVGANAGAGGVAAVIASEAKQPRGREW